ncbi:unnamed protein product [Urochloa humidicola]
MIHKPKEYQNDTEAKRISRTSIFATMEIKQHMYLSEKKPGILSI